MTPKSTFARIVRNRGRIVGYGVRGLRTAAAGALVLAQHGPAEFGRYALRAVHREAGAHDFPNGISTSVPVERALNWHLTRRKPLVVALLGAEGDVADWMTRAQGVLHCHFLVSPDRVTRLSAVDHRFFSAEPSIGDADSTDFVRLLGEMRRSWRRCDLLLLDTGNDLPTPEAVIRLQHASRTYDPDCEIGIVSPARADGLRTVSGWDYDRAARVWREVDSTTAAHQEHRIPRYVLNAPVHALYVTSETIDRLRLPIRRLEGLSLASQISLLIACAWQQNIRTLSFCTVEVPVASHPQPVFLAEHREWLGDRPVERSRRRRIIFVLNATSISGGIRTVFEEAVALRDRGFDVEIWSLQGQPTWTDLPIEVQTFRSYSDLLMALRHEDAIKVATWWETAQIVWLASVNHGIPVNFVQEFETWFYPGDPEAQAAVVSSYRHEFATMTIAAYQRDELKAVGVDAPIIPVGFDEARYHPLEGVDRDPDTMLAVGRSFFQKNFAMTRAAWLELEDDRPPLELFGFEPDILVDSRVDYTVRPTDEAVNRLYNRAAFFVQTSRHEGFCLPLIEAMATGCPVITTDAHGNRDFCVDGENCIIVDHDDVEALAGTIRALIADSDLRRRLGDAGLRTAERYRWSVITDALEAFYSEL